MCKYKAQVTFACNHNLGVTEFEGLCKEQNDLRKQGLPFERCPPPDEPNPIVVKTELCWRCNDQMSWCTGPLTAGMIVGEQALTAVGPDAVARVLSIRRDEWLEREKAKLKKEAEEKERLKRARYYQEQLDAALDTWKESEALDVIRMEEADKAEKKRREALAEQEAIEKRDSRFVPESSAEVEMRQEEERKQKRKKVLDKEVRDTFAAWEKSKGRSSPSAEAKKEAFRKAVEASKKDPESTVAEVVEAKNKKSKAARGSAESKEAQTEQVLRYTPADLLSVRMLQEALEKGPLMRKESLLD